MATVTLHVGAFKTGTSFIQTVLSNNKSALADDGVLWPGDQWSQQVKAAQGLIRAKERDMSDWRSLVREIDAWGGPEVLISMESLSLAKPRKTQRAIETLSNHRVRVILTVRDVGRVLPAQWQESVQNSDTWSYQEYLEGVTNPGTIKPRPHRHFWAKQDAPKILRSWNNAVPIEDIILVTVPPQDAPRGLLWNRFCEAARIDPERYDVSVRVNESLGAASAETVRYVSAAMAAGDFPVNTSRVVKKRLAKQIMAAHKSMEPVLILPPEHEAWALRESERIVSEIREIGPKIIGDLSDLTPRFDTPKGEWTTDPSALPTPDLLRAAAHALVTMCADQAGSGRNRRHADEE